MPILRVLRVCLYMESLTWKVFGACLRSFSENGSLLIYSIPPKTNMDTQTSHN